MNYNILICDDDKDIVNAISIYLKAEGYRVLCAYNGQEALDILKGYHWDENGYKGKQNRL